MKLKFSVLAVLIFAQWIIFNNATASNYHTKYPPIETTSIVNNMTVTSGVSDHDLQQGLSAAIAGGSHQFDYSTTDWQLSLTGAWEVSDEQETGFSFGLGKRWKENAILPDALFHFSYTPNGSQDYIMFGGTIRIK